MTGAAWRSLADGQVVGPFGGTVREQGAAAPYSLLLSLLPVLSSSVFLSLPVPLSTVTPLFFLILSLILSLNSVTLSFSL